MILAWKININLRIQNEIEMLRLMQESNLQDDMLHWDWARFSWAFSATKQLDLLKKLEFSLDMSRQTSNMRSPRNGERVNICLKNRSHATCQEESTLHEQHFWHQDLLLSRPPSRPSAYLLKLQVPIPPFESNPSHPFTETGNAEALRFRSIHISALLRLTNMDTHYISLWYICMRFLVSWDDMLPSFQKWKRSCH